jgi:membrane-associated phospholipid phosphatase
MRAAPRPRERETLEEALSDSELVHIFAHNFYFVAAHIVAMRQRGRLGAAATALDQRVSSALYRAGVAVPRPAWKLLEWSGDGLVWLALSLAVVLAPATPPLARQLWANLLLGLLLDLAAVGLLKAAARRERPVYNAAAGDMVVVVAVDRFSFPSGHSSRAAFLATYAAAVAGAAAAALPPPLPLPPPLGLAPAPRALAAAAAAWAATLALSRCAMGRHYLGDVAAGLALGVATAGAVTRFRFDAGGLLLGAQTVQAAAAAAASYVPGLR